MSARLSEQEINDGKKNGFEFRSETHGDYLVKSPFFIAVFPFNMNGAEGRFYHLYEAGISKKDPWCINNKRIMETENIHRLFK